MASNSIWVINRVVTAYKWTELMSEIDKAAHRSDEPRWAEYLADLGEEMNRRLSVGDVPSA